MPRAQTVPSLSSDPKPSGKRSPVLLTIDTSKGEEDPTPEEICLSPSWSDHGEKRRKKEKKRIEKEQKEAERKLRQDEERQRLADIKAGKRLSKKPPPVAMETQKMPQALRRNSWVSVISSRTSSGENTRRSSREERRLSGVSIGSTDSQTRSRSTPATSTEEAHDPARTSGQWHSVISSAAPKIPNFGWSSRRTSSGTNKSLSWGSDDGYTREIISFAYRLDGSPTNSEHKRTNEAQGQQGQQGPTTPTRQEVIPTFGRSVTEPNMANFTQHSMSRSPQRSPAKKDKTQEPSSQHGPKGTLPEQRYSAQSLKAGPNFRNELAGEIDAIIASHQQKPGQTLPSPRSSQTRSSYDGSSYVHKQRMYQQQRSIAGFEDEQAVKDANEMAAESGAPVLEDGQQTGSRQAAHDSHQQYSNTVSVMPSTADDRVPVSPKNKTSVTQPDIKPSTMKQPSPVKQQADAAPSSPFKPANTKGTAKGQESTPVRTSLQSVRDSASLNKTQIVPSSKTDKVISFRRRPKMAPSKISVPDNVQNNTVALRNIPPAVIVIEEAPEKRLKVERISQEVKPKHNNTSGRKASESSARSQPEKSLPEPNRAPSHARNRTSSSTALSDNLPSPLSPKSVAEPNSTSSNKGSRQAGANGDSREPRIEAEPRSPKSPKRRQTSLAITDKALPETPAAVNEAPAPDATKSKETPDIKPLPEVVVESTTEEGLVRKPSIKRPLSNPQLQPQTTVTNPLPSLDFLPQLKHQPLVKREPHFLPLGKDRFPPVPTNYATIKIMANKSAASSNAPDLKLIPRSPLRTPSQFPVPGRTFNRSSTEIGTVSSVKGPVAEGMEAKPMAKLFVICCKCKFWHDLPSKLYEAMALPKELHKDEDVAAGKGKGQVAGARLETAVKCPWCEHAMTTWCCQGWTTVVYLHERHH